MSPENIELEEQRVEPDGIYLPEESNGFVRYEQPPKQEVTDNEPSRGSADFLVAAIGVGLAAVSLMVMLWPRPEPQITHPKQAPAAECVQRDAPKLAYLLHRYQDTTSDFTAAAVAVVAHDALDPSGQWESDRRAMEETETGRKILTRAEELEAEATAMAGPYSVAPELSLPAPGDTRGSITGMHVRTGAGEVYPDSGITMTLTGPATFSEGTQQMTAGPENTQTIPVLFSTTEVGTVSLTASAQGLPPTMVTRCGTDVIATVPDTTVATGQHEVHWIG